MADDFRTTDADSEDLLDQWNLADDDPSASSRGSRRSERRFRFKAGADTTSVATAVALDVEESAVVQDFNVGSEIDVDGDGDASVPGGRAEAEVGGEVTCLYDPDGETRPRGRSTAEPPPERSTLPRPGDVVGDFQLVIELGRGAFARVFLAEEVKLGRRLVALKVSRAEGEEPQILARLQHAHIVPVHSVHDDPATGLRLLCMPFLGGANLAQVLEELNGRTGDQGAGNSFVDALDQLSQRLPGKAAESLSVNRRSIGRGVSRVRGGSSRRLLRRDLAPGEEEANARDADRRAGSRRPSRARRLWRRLHERLRRPTAPEAAPATDLDEKLPSRRFLRGADSLRAAAWIVARLAEGLEHAHERGLLHRDLKPSNVLIAADGTPMLLDFNLAVAAEPGRESATEGEAELEKAKLGGTLPYMAPEHLDAFDPKGCTPVGAVDERSDLYSLGLILFEMIAGEPAFDPPPSRGVSLQTLRGMVRERRQSPPPSLRARRPDVPHSLDALVAQCLAPDPDHRYATAADLAEDLRRFLDDLPMKHCPEPSLTERVNKWRRRHPVLSGSTSVVAAAVAAVVVLGLAAGQAYEGMQGLRSRVSLRIFQRDALECRFLLNTFSRDGGFMRRGAHLAESTLAMTRNGGAGAAEEWSRSSFDRGSAPWISRLASDERDEVRRTVVELAMQLEHARVVLASRKGDERERRSALNNAVARLDQIEAAVESPPSVLYRQRARYQTALGDVEAARSDRQRADARPPTTGHEWTMLGSFLFVNGDLAGAERALREAVARDVTSFWAWFNLGHCHFEQNRFPEAVSDFTACAVARPEFAWGHFNRGLALARSGRPREARDAYTTCLSIDDDFAEALVDRGMVALELGDPAAAEADLRRGMDLGRRDPAVLAALGDAMVRQGKAAEADRMFDAWIARKPGDATLRVARGIIRLSTDPDSAAEDFRTALETAPNHALAQYGLARILRETDRPSTLTLLDRAISTDPNLIEAYELRAVELARNGDRAALDDVDRLIKSPTPQRLYNAACALSILGRERGDARFLRRAVETLGGSFQAGFPPERAETDPDLAPLRGRDDYRALSARQAPGGAH